MAKVIITERLEQEISKRFKAESIEIFSLLLTLEDNPKKGKEVGAVGNVVVKELKYKGYRFYFVTDRHKIKFLKSEELQDLLVKFVRMSDKKEQKRVIGEIKHVLRVIGEF